MAYDLKALKATQEHCDEMVQANSKRNEVFKAMEDLYWMEWGDENNVKQKMQNPKVTRSPKARNDIIGAIRLLIAADPLIAVPRDINNASAVNLANRIEKFTKAMLFASGRMSGDPLHYDVVKSSLLFSEVDIAINSTKDMLDAAKDANPAAKRRLEIINQRTPFLFEVLHPKSCYSERDRLGLTAFYRKTETTIADVQNVFGKAADAALMSTKGKKDYQKYDVVTLCDYYDLEDRVVWLDGYEQPILQDKHGLPFIPVVSQLTEGSRLFNDEDQKREPFLYTLYKSGLVDRQNLILTVLYTTMFAIGANPMFVDFLIDPDNPHPVDYSVPGGTVHYRVGERREAMNKQVIDPSLLQGWDIAGDLEMQSTIYRQALGEPLSGNAPFSSVALLSQSGRLPLIATQKKAGWAMGEALEIALQWLRHDKRSGTAKFEDKNVTLDGKEVPENLDINVTLEVELPQDRLQSANAANMLAQGDNPLVSRRWVQENILNIGQPEDMVRDIWNEQASTMYFNQFMTQQMMQLQQMQQAQQAMMQQQMQGGSGSGGGTPGGMRPPMGGAMPPMNMPPQGGPMPMPGKPNMGTPPQPQMPERQVMPPAEPMPPVPPAIGRGEVPE